MGDKGLVFHKTLQDAAAATGNGTAMDVGGLSTVGVQVTGTFVGTITWEGTIDETNWVAVRALNLNTGAVATTATAAGLVQIPVAGLSQLRARVSAYTSGSITAVARGIFASPGYALTS